MGQQVCVVLSAAEREQLAAIVADRNRPRKHVERARIVLKIPSLPNSASVASRSISATVVAPMTTPRLGRVSSNFTLFPVISSIPLPALQSPLGSTCSLLVTSAATGTMPLVRWSQCSAPSPRHPLTVEFRRLLLETVCVHLCTCTRRLI